MERKILIFLLFEGVMNAVSGQTPVLQIIQPATEVGSNFTLQCTVTINKAIEFQLNNTGQGSCSAPFLGMLGTCTPSDITQNLTTAVTSWTISPAQPEHDGKWICALGSTDSNEADLQIYQLPGSIITQNGISSDVIVNDTSSYPIVVEVDCLFSGNGPIVELQFAATVNTSVAMTCTTLSTVCSACTGCSAYNCSIILNKALISGQISVNTAYTLYIKVGVTGTTEKFTKPISSPHTVKFERTSPIAQMSSSKATARTTSINSISELSNTMLPIISDSTTATSGISASTSSFLNTGTTNYHSNTETTTTYTNTETSNLNTNIETSNFDSNTRTNEIKATNTLRVVLNNMTAYQSMFVTTETNDISGSFEIPIQIMTETLAVPGYSISSYNEIISTSTFERSTIFPQTVFATSISLHVDSFMDSLLHTLHVSSGSLITNDSSEYSILTKTITPSNVGDSYIASLSTLFSAPSLTDDKTDSAFEISNVSRFNHVAITNETIITPMTTATVESRAINTAWNSKTSKSLLLSISENNSRIQQIVTNTESPLMSTTFIDPIPYFSKMEDPSFLSYEYLSDIILSLPKISESSHLPSSIIDTMDNFVYTLITSYLADTRHSFKDFTDGFETFARDYAFSASTSFIQTTDRHSSLQTTEYHATMQKELLSYVTTSFYVAPGIYSTEIATSGKSYISSSVKPSQTQLASMNDVQGSTNNFQSTYDESYFPSTIDFFSSEISEYLLSSLQSTSLLLQFNTQPNASGVESDMKTTSMSTFESQSGKIDRSIFTNTVLISNVLSDFKTNWVTTTISFNSKTMSSMIKPSCQQTSSGNSYIEIDASFKDSLLSFGSDPGSRTSNYPVITSLSSGILKSIRTLSPNTVQSGLDEVNKNIIFITSMSAVLSIIVVILLIIFAKVYMTKNNTKPRKEDDDISWSNKSIPPKTAFSNDLFIGNSIYPLVHTSSAAFKKHPYEHNWNDIV